MQTPLYIAGFSGSGFVANLTWASGASKQIRTADLILTKDALCHLSYGSKSYGDPERARTVDLQRDRLAF